MQSNKRALPYLLAGTAFVGTVDILYAIGFWAFRGVPPIAILQSISAGLLGRAAFSGGSGTAILGLALHYFIALAIVVVYWLAGRRIDVLFRRYILFGALYGLAVYGVMNYVVLPLSAAGKTAYNPAWVICSVIVHVVLIGIPAAVFARQA
ncbi:MAG TPA: hypothetical protein VF846_07180 [Thermoanaerobaculia bacterium]|jgi:hypothetical protein